ncbi:hypothetical protein JXQ70_19820 [bacterium]|nr:hypothetical protein [bacterium]
MIKDELLFLSQNGHGDLVAALKEYHESIKPFYPEQLAAIRQEGERYVRNCQN